MISRRNFLLAALAATAAHTLATPVPSARASTQPRQGAQAPGHYHLRVGSAEVTALCDGSGKVAPAMLHGIGQGELNALLGDAGLPTDAPSSISVNAFLVNTAEGMVLIDSGAGRHFGPDGGQLANNIRASGHDPAQVDVVLLTHLHPDHAQGLTTIDGTPVYPNARVLTSDAEAAYWLSDSLLAAISPERRRHHGALRDALAPYKAKGRFTTFPLATAPLPQLSELSAVPLPGHTPGHCGFRLHSKGQTLLAWGDIVHSTAVQFARPEVSIDYDVDRKAAVTTRLSLLPQVAAEGCWVAGSHLPFPGLGRVRARNGGKEGYAWLPVDHADGL